MRVKVKNPFLNFYRYSRRHGVKKAWRDTCYNYAMLDTPEQMLRKQIIGYLGSMAGIVFAGIVFWIKGSKQLIPLFCFSLLIMWANFRNTLKQYYTYQQAKEQYKDIPELNPAGGFKT